MDSSFQINPDMNFAFQVRGWYDNQLSTNPNFQFQAYTMDSITGGNGNEIIKSISQIKDDNLGCGDKVIWQINIFTCGFYYSCWDYCLS